MPMIWRRFEAEAAHHLPLVRDGHKCKHVHGHNFQITVCVSRPGLEDGMVIDFEVLDAIWTEHIKPRFDHKLVNDWIPNPTSEMIAMLVQQRFAAELKDPTFEVVVEVEENDRSGARYP